LVVTGNLSYDASDRFDRELQRFVENAPGTGSEHMITRSELLYPSKQDLMSAGRDV